MLSRSRLFPRLFGLTSYSFSTAAAAKGGDLYTWGLYASGTGFGSASLKPRRLEQFNKNVKKVSMGVSHTAVITTDGTLYTFGNGEKGALGNGSEGFDLYPSPVAYFAEKQIKIADVLAGDLFTVAITETGSVFSWGVGGQPSSRLNLDFLTRVFQPERCSGLGSGNNLNRLNPDIIANLNATGNKGLTGGANFVNLLTQSGEVVNWGSGLKGQLGNGSDFPVFSPVVNHYFKGLKEKEGVSVVSVKSASNFSVALLSNGQLLSFGSNTHGQLGIRQNLGHTTDQIAILPTPINAKKLAGQKVVDYQVGSNSLLILTDKNEVFFSGLDLAYMPIRWEVPTTEKIVSIAASLDSFAAVTASGKIYQFNDFAKGTTNEVGTDYNVLCPKHFSGKVTQIGGSYGTRYALVE